MTQPNRLLVDVSLLAAHGVDGLNDTLERAGHGRPLVADDPAPSPIARLVPLHVDGLDSETAVDVLRQVADPAGVHSDVGYTSGANGPLFTGTYGYLGEKTGLGAFDWIPAEKSDMDAEKTPAWRPLTKRPVVAVLDSGVWAAHPYFPEPVDGQAFVVEAPGWETPSLHRVPVGPHGASHAGHATFIAGIIRRVAPDAQVLSMRVMEPTGHVSEPYVVRALDWLNNTYLASGDRHVDVVLMAFGRVVENSDNKSDTAMEVRRGIDALATRGVRVVCAAGNTGKEDYVFPANASNVISVGAGKNAQAPQSFSTRGAWVTEWRLGGEVVSTVPPVDGDGNDSNVYGRWSGTSFSAAILAGELADAVPVVKASG